MKSIIASIILAGLVIAGAIVYAGGGFSKSDNNVPENNVTLQDGKQFVEIRARGGYLPRVSTAKAGLPTVLRIDTNGTYDCSASIRIPSLNVLKTLPPTGTTDIELGTSTPGILQGMCGMGMYPFEIDFQ
jgi:plastocyanin domain-containing protein